MLAGIRAVVAVLAVPLAPTLYRDHFVVLVLLRPTKDVLVFGGFLLRDGDVGLVPVLAAAVPLVVGGVWLSYALGRAYASELRSKDSDIPKWARRILSRKRVNAMGDVLEANRVVAILGGRLSVFPSSVLGAAAGATNMSARDFLVLDGVGGLLSIVEVVGVGYALGSAYERGSRWVTIVGAVVFIGVLALIGRWIRNQASRSSRPRKR